MVVNAGNIDKNFKWLNNHIIDDVIIQDKSSDISLIAIQGPNTRKFLSKITDRILDPPESRLKILCILFLFNPMF